MRRFLLPLLVALMLLPFPAEAHTGDSSRLFPATSQVLTATPQEFVLPTPGAEEPPRVRLFSFSSGETIPEVRPAQLRRGDGVWFPPTLTAGTYHLSWEYVADGVRHREQSFFSMSRPSHQVTLLQLPSSSWPLAGLALLVLLAVLLLPGSGVLPAVVAVSAASLPLLLPLLGVPASAPLPVRLLPPAAALLLFPPRSVAFRPLLAAVAAALLLFPPVSPVAMLAAVCAAAVLASAMALLPSGPFGGWRPAAAAGMLALPLLLYLRFGSEVLAFPTLLLLLPALLLPLLAIRALVAGAREVLPSGTTLLAAAAAASAVALALLPSEPAVTDIAQVAAAPAACLAEGDALAVQRCLEVAYTEKVFTIGVRPALEDLDVLVRQAPSARFYCHAASHAVGRAAFSTEGSVPAAFASGFDVCDFGFFHGIVEASAAGLDNEDFERMVAEVCMPLLSESQLLFLQCNHGIGHAAARRSNNDMVLGLGFCEALRAAPMPEGLRDAALNGCGTGVTMEWFNIAAIVPDPSSALSPSVATPRDVCFEIPAVWQPECFEYVGNTVESSRPFESLLGLAEWCAATPYPQDCAVGLARSAAGLSIPPLQVLEVCERVDPSSPEGCIRSFLVFTATTVQFDAGWVESACMLLPERLRSGPDSVCRSAYEASRTLLEQSGTRLG